MITLLAQSVHLPSPNLLEALMWDRANFFVGNDFPDDVSGLMFDYRGPT